MVSTKWAYHKERSFVSNYLIFLKILSKFKNFLYQQPKYPYWCNNDPNAHIGTFCRLWSFIWRYFFPVSILKDFPLQILIIFKKRWWDFVSFTFHFPFWKMKKIKIFVKRREKFSTNVRLSQKLSAQIE